MRWCVHTYVLRVLAAKCPYECNNSVDAHYYCWCTLTLTLLLLVQLEQRIIITVSTVDHLYKCHDIDIACNTLLLLMHSHKTTANISHRAVDSYSRLT
jgi:hypothetical protein